MIGVAATAEKDNSPDFSYYICGILGTLSFIMVNTVTNEMLNGTGLFYLMEIVRILSFDS